MDWFIGKVGWDIFVPWLYGPAGAGKSAIAQTFAEQCSATNGLLASFFFSRSDSRRDSEKTLVATLAYQVSLRIPGFWTILEPTINKDPSVFQLNFETQFQTLILGPLLQLANTSLFVSGEPLPYLFIIDGLDECKGSDVQKSILYTISNALQRHRLTLPFIFLIASRPEHHLTIPFSDVSLIDLTFRLALDNTYQPNKDIRLYLIDSFRVIRQTHILSTYLPDSWPSEDDIDKLVTKSSGQFIYASTVIRYVSCPRHNPTNRLKVIQGLFPADNDQPYAQLDALYINILSSVEDIEAALSILGVSIVVNYTSVENLEKFMLLAPGSIRLLLLDLSSVVDISDEEVPIKFLHASFRDFLLDSKRSGQYHVNPLERHGEAARLCMTHIGLSTTRDVVSQDKKVPQLDVLGRAFFFLGDNLQKSDSLNGNATLREQVYNLPYVESLSTLTSEYIDSVSWHGRNMLARFLTFLRTSDFHGTQELYLHHRGVWDQMMREDLASVPENRGLAFWISCLVTIDINAESVYLETIMSLPSSSEVPEAFLYVPLSIFTGVAFDDVVISDEAGHYIASRPDVQAINFSSKYLYLLKDFLSDSSRAGPYVADESTYTTAAEFVVEFAVRPWDEKKKRIKSYDGQWDLIWEAIVSIFSRAGQSSYLLEVLSSKNPTFILGRPIFDAQLSLRSMFRALSGYLLRWQGAIADDWKIIIDCTLWKPDPEIVKLIKIWEIADGFETDRVFYLNRSINN